MNYPSKEFIEIDEWKWNDIPAVDNVKSVSYSENLKEDDGVFTTSKTSLVLCFLCNDVTSEAKILEPSQILCGWVSYTEEATNPDFNTA